ncbi:hypothetical protein ABZX65_29275 [Streptomyces sp. NPDC003300]|uniref:hypothetical protein n=1 Tax=unclassified Streptomyces TaxID=2593676 RepID=UPI0033ADFAC8
MGSDLVRRGYDLPERRPRREAARQAREFGEIQHRGELDIAQLVNTGKHEEVRAILRKRITEDGIQDVTDIAHLTVELAGNDPFLASLLVPIAQEFARTTARDIRDFGRRRSL